MPKRKSILTILAAIAAMAGMAPTVPAMAETPTSNCMLRYYETRSQACLDAILQDHRNRSNAKTPEQWTLIGFLYGVFKTSPNERQRIITSETDDNMINAEAYALTLAGYHDEISEAPLSKTPPPAFVKNAHQTSIEQFRPTDNPSDNDLLIGAFLATGDKIYLRHMLENFENASEDETRSAIRLSLIQSKFGGNSTPPGRQSFAAMLCQLKSCPPNDPTPIKRILTLMTTFSTTSTLALDNQNAKEAVDDFSKTNPRYAQLISEEKAALDNYVTTLIPYQALKNALSADQIESFFAIDDSIVRYETFKPASETIEPITSLIKKWSADN